jgi:glutamate racemase
VTRAVSVTRAAPRLGVLDWGVGGMGFVRALRQRAPGVPFLYVSDTGSTPYGKLSSSALASRIDRVLDAIAAEGAVAVVVACNAASTVLPLLARRAIPVTGVVEHALRLVPRSFRGTLGVLGGARTIRSGVYRRGLAAPGRRVVSRVAQPLSAHVEAGTADSPGCRDAIDRILRPLRHADALLLACTHYPAIAPLLLERAPGACLYDPVDALAAYVARVVVPPRFARLDRLARPVPDRWLTTGDPRAMRSSTRRAWGFDPGPCARWLTAPR